MSPSSQTFSNTDENLTATRREEITMTPDELCDLLLLLVSDDYESFCYIEEQTRECLSKIGGQVSTSDIESALRKLIAQGDVSAFLLDSQRPDAEAVLVDSRPMSQLWFYATKDGQKKAHILAEVAQRWFPT